MSPSSEKFAMEWAGAPQCCGLPLCVLCKIGSLAPLAGACLMFTCRGGALAYDQFLKMVTGEVRTDGRLDRPLSQTVYLRRLAQFIGRMCSYEKEDYPGLFQWPSLWTGHIAEHIAAGIEFGADADLVFACVLIQHRFQSNNYPWPIYLEECFEDYSEPCEYDYERAGRDPDAVEPGDFFDSTLYSACGPRGSDAVVSLLLQVKAPVDKRAWFREGDDDVSVTPLFRALQGNRVSAVRMLLRCGADLHITGGATRIYRSGPCEHVVEMAPAGYACQTQKAEMLATLLDYRACPSQRFQSGGRDFVGWKVMKSRALLYVYAQSDHRCCCRLCTERHYRQ